MATATRNSSTTNDGRGRRTKGEGSPECLDETFLFGVRSISTIPRPLGRSSWGLSHRHTLETNDPTSIHGFPHSAPHLAKPNSPEPNQVPDSQGRSSADPM